MVSQQSTEVRCSPCPSVPLSISIFPPEFRVASSGMAWRGEDAEAVIAMSSTDIKWARWLRVARGFQLRVGLKDRRREVFDGFERDVSPFSSSQAMFLIRPRAFRTTISSPACLSSISPLRWRQRTSHSEAGTGERLTSGVRNLTSVFSAAMG